MAGLQRFKLEQLSRLVAIKQQYSNNQRVWEIVENHLIPKLQHLRAMDLANYIFELYLASREFSAFEELIPSEQEVDALIEDKSKLFYFRAKYMARLMRLRRELKAKHPDKADKIENIVFDLATRLHLLRRDGLTDYLFTATLACKEFPEFCSLVPSEEEIKQLFVVPKDG